MFADFYALIHYMNLGKKRPRKKAPGKKRPVKSAHGKKRPGNKRPGKKRPR